VIFQTKILVLSYRLRLKDWRWFVTIAYVKGVVEEYLDEGVVLDNGGIGYIINLSNATLSRLPAKGEFVQLHTFTQVKDDGWSLYGFLQSNELRLFKMLIAVHGVGPKAAMSVLSIMTPEEIISAVVNQDSLSFSRAPGIGVKTAKRITLELYDKMKNVSPTTDMPTANFSTEKQDAIDALLALGYARNESVKAVLSVADENMQSDQIIRLALKKLM